MDLIDLVFHGFMMGAVTFYPADKFEGNPLYCAQYLGDHLTYSRETAERYGMWVALDVSLYESGVVKCGDQLTIWYGGSEFVDVVALDAGTFEGYYVADWPELPIIADVPEYFQDTSRRGVLFWQR